MRKLPIGVTPAHPMVRVEAPVDDEGENGWARDGHNNDDGKDNGVHRIAPSAPIVPQRVSMALGRPAHKGPSANH